MPESLSLAGYVSDLKAVSSEAEEGCLLTATISAVGIVSGPGLTWGWGHGHGDAGSSLPHGGGREQHFR